MLKTSVVLGGFENMERFRQDLKSIKAAGFDGIDLQMHSAVFRESLHAEHALDAAERLRDVIESAGLKILQCHPPFNPYSYENPQKGEAVISDCKLCIPYAAALGVKLLVMHPKRPRAPEDPLYHQVAVFHQWNLQLYEELLSLADQYGVTLLTENLFSVEKDGKHIPGYSSSADELLALTEHFPQLGVCFDIGHALVLQQNPAEQVRLYGQKLKALHLHNNDGKHDLHLEPFSKVQIDWQSFGQALKDIGYSGSINLECFFADQVPDVIRPLAYQYLGECARYIAAFAE